MMLFKVNPGFSKNDYWYQHDVVVSVANLNSAAKIDWLWHC